MNIYDIFGSGRKPAVTESKIEVVHEYVNEDFSGLMFGANNEDIAGPGGSDNNDSTSPIHGFGEDYDNIPDLENVGEQVVSIMDAERRLAQGDRIFAFHEMDEEPSEIHDVGQLAGYDAEQLLAVPQGVAEGFGAPASAGSGDQRVTIIGGPEMYVGKSGWLGKMSPQQAQKYPGYVLVHLNHGGGSTLLPKAAVKIEQGVAEGLSDVVKGVKRAVKGKTDPTVAVAHRSNEYIKAVNTGDKDAIRKTERNLDRVNKVTHGKLGEQGVAEGLPQTLRKVVPGYAKREIDKKMDAGKFGKTDADKDANFQRYKKIQDKLKNQGVAEAPHDDEVDYDDKYQAMVKRVGQKAREQQRHEPVDLVKLAQRLRQADKTTDTTDEDVMESRLSAMKRAGYDIL